MFILCEYKRGVFIYPMEQNLTKKLKAIEAVSIHKTFELK